MSIVSPTRRRPLGSSGTLAVVKWLPGIRSLRSQAKIHPFDPGAFAPTLRTRLLILQPTPFCNLDCDYCYLPNREDRSRMSIDTARTAARRLAEDGLVGSSVTVVWHAGEPLVLPPSYYEQAFAVVAEEIGPDCELTHSIQTNGTLINDEWCELFIRHKVQVGVSVDGPADLHDLHRRTRSGGGTHAKVVAGMNRLKARQIPFHAIAVVTKDSLDHARELRDFFVDAGVQEVGLNFDEAEGVHSTSSLRDHEAEHQAFLSETFALSSQSAGRYRIREFANALRLIAHDPPTYTYKGQVLPENGQTIPFAIVTVAWNGDFSTFSPELIGQPNAQYANFVLGNVASGSYLEAGAGDLFARLWNNVQRGISACAVHCTYFKYCGGGAPANKLFENGTLESTETIYCRSMVIRPFETVLRALESDGILRGSQMTTSLE